MAHKIRAVDSLEADQVCERRVHGRGAARKVHVARAHFEKVERLSGLLQLCRGPGHDLGSSSISRRPQVGRLNAHALAELAASQEAATAAHLMAEMEGFVDPGTAEYFMRESI